MTFSDDKGIVDTMSGDPIKAVFLNKELLFFNPLLPERPSVFFNPLPAAGGLRCGIQPKRRGNKTFRSDLGPNQLWLARWLAEPKIEPDYTKALAGSQGGPSLFKLNF